MSRSSVDSDDVNEIDQERELLNPIHDTNETEPADNTINSNSKTDLERAGSNNSLVIRAVIPILLLGTFMSNADNTVVVASYGKISSEFDNLRDAMFLMTGFTLTMCAVQPLYGKLSDIFGRRPLLLVSYSLFNLGLLITALGTSMWIVIAGRMISGIGGAGMTSLVSTIVADLVPVRDIATWRSYINIVATTGRSAGGPIGGFLTDTIGWRWAFLGQIPFVILASLLVYFKIKEPHPMKDGLASSTTMNKVKRIDFVGAFFLTSFIVVFLLAFDLGGQRYPWSSPIIYGSLIAAVVLVLIFILIEKYYAKEPIFKLELLTNRDVYTSYAIAGLQMGSQHSLFFCIPLYFQVTFRMSTAASGFRLIPPVFGNALAGLLVGHIIKRTGKYKSILSVGCLSSVLAAALLVWRWNGHTSWYESLYVFFGGFGNGVSYSASFIALSAGISTKDQAVATGGYYLCYNTGMVIGLSFNTAIRQTVLTKELMTGFANYPEKDSIISKLMNDLEFVKTASKEIRDIAVPAYVQSIRAANGVSLIEAAIAFGFTLIIKEKLLKR